MMMGRAHEGISVIVYVITAVVLGGWGVDADRTLTKVYEPVEGSVACFKRLNGTHEIGCRSSSRGEVGILHLIEDDQSLKWVLEDGPHKPYIAVVYPENFTRENIMKFKNSDRINGVLLLGERKPRSTSLQSFSTDSTCPNEGLGIYDSKTPQYCPKWNAPGNDVLYESFDFPIFYVNNNTEADKIVKCFETFNKPVNNTAQDWPLCAAQLKSFMLAAVDTPTCLRRSRVFSINPGAAQVCQALGDKNLWGSLFFDNQTSQTSNDTYPDDSVIVIGARLDGASLFDEVTPSADSSITALVTILAIVKHLAGIKDQLSEYTSSSSIKNVYFMLFNGEAFGYIGSSRIAYDMKQNKFPLKLNQISHFIEINQAALRNGESYFIHQAPDSQSKHLTNILYAEGQSQNINLTVVPAKQNEWGLPPASLQSFIKERNDLTGIVITNHQKSYRNLYYNSIFDDKKGIEYTHGDRSLYSVQQQIAGLAASVTNSIIQLMNATSVPKVEADVEAVDELLYCYLESGNCSIFKQVYGITSKTPYPTYVSVAHQTNILTQITQFILINYLSEKVEQNITEDNCWKENKERNYFWINGTCLKNNLVNLTEAISPAFIIDNYDWSSGKYSTWTESIWQPFSVRIFLKPSLFHEIMTLISGIIVVIVSFAVVRMINLKADILFPSRTDAMVC